MSDNLTIMSAELSWPTPADYQAAADDLAAERDARALAYLDALERVKRARHEALAHLRSYGHPNFPANPQLVELVEALDEAERLGGVV